MSNIQKACVFSNLVFWQISPTKFKLDSRELNHENQGPEWARFSREKSWGVSWHCPFNLLTITLWLGWSESCCWLGEDVLQMFLQEPQPRLKQYDSVNMCSIIIFYIITIQLKNNRRFDGRYNICQSVRKLKVLGSHKAKGTR